MKNVLVLVSTLLVVAPWLVASAPSLHFVPGTRSTYHGVLGTFDVTPGASVAQVYTPFAQTVLPQTVEYSGYPAYQFQVASPVINYYNPSVSYLGAHQFGAVSFLGAAFAPPVTIPGVTGVPNYPGLPGSSPDTASEAQVPDSISIENQPQMPTESQPETTPEAQPQNDTVDFDDNDTVTIDSV